MSYDIVKEFDSVIIAQLYGHLHSDEFRVGLADESGSTANSSTIPLMNTPLLLGPSVTPLHGNDPSFRLVKYDRGGGGSETQYSKYRLVDYDSHRYSMGKGGHWSKLYSFSEAYDVAYDAIKEGGLTSESFRIIAKSMEDRWGAESPLLRSYRSKMLSGADGSVVQKGANVDCDSNCRNEVLCTIQSATRSGYDNCLLERKFTWTGRTISGIVGALAFASALIIFVIIRWRKRRKRDNYKSTDSVTDGNNIDDEIDANDHEMTLFDYESTSSLVTDGNNDDEIDAKDGDNDEMI